MKIQITSGGIYGADGELPIGTLLEMDDEPKAWAGRYSVVPEGEAKTFVTNPAGGQEGEVTGTGTDAPNYQARDNGNGWWSVFDATGAEVGKKMRADDAATFNEMTAEEREQYVKAEA